MDKTNTPPPLWPHFKQMMKNDRFALSVMAGSAALLLWFRYICFDGERGLGNDFFMKAILDLTSGYLITYLGLLGYMFGLLSLMVTVERTTWKKVSSAMRKTSCILIDSSIAYLAMLIPISGFLYYWFGKYFWMVCAPLAFGFMLLTMMSVRYVFNNKGVPSELRKHEPWRRWTVYGTLAFAGGFILYIAARHGLTS